MPYMSLIKLLYLADRRALFNHGRPISYDFFVSMPHGPVLSRTYGLIIEEPDPDQPSYWRTYISEPDNYKVELTQDYHSDHDFAGGGFGVGQYEPQMRFANPTTGNKEGCTSPYKLQGALWKIVLGAF